MSAAEPVRRPDEGVLGQEMVVIPNKSAAKGRKVGGRREDPDDQAAGQDHRRAKRS